MIEPEKLTLAIRNVVIIGRSRQKCLLKWAVASEGPKTVEATKNEISKKISPAALPLGYISGGKAAKPNKKGAIL